MGFVTGGASTRARPSLPDGWRWPWRSSSSPMATCTRRQTWRCSCSPHAQLRDRPTCRVVLEHARSHDHEQRRRRCSDDMKNLSSVNFSAPARAVVVLQLMLLLDDHRSCLAAWQGQVAAHLLLHEQERRGNDRVDMSYVGRGAVCNTSGGGG